MASLFTAPRSRPVTYDAQPPTAAELDKEVIAADNKARYTSPADKAKRVVAEQIPVSKYSKAARQIPGYNSKFILPGVQSIKWTMAREITEQYGLQSFTLLPWYTKAVAITITGKAYLGAFATDLTAANGLVNTSLQNKGIIEYIRDEMREMDSKLSGYNITSRNSNASSSLSLLSTLSVGVDGEPGSIKVLGFVKSFDVDENVATPFVQQYTLVYLGVDMDWYLQARSRNRVLLDGYKLPSPMGKQTEVAGT